MREFIISLAGRKRNNQASRVNRRKSASDGIIRKLLLPVSEYRDLIFSRACFIFELYCLEMPGPRAFTTETTKATAFIEGRGVSFVIFPRVCLVKSSMDRSVKGKQTSAEHTVRIRGIQNKNTVLWIAPSADNRREKVNGTRYQITRNSSRCPVRWQPGNTSVRVTMNRDLKIWSLFEKRGRGGTKREEPISRVRWIVLNANSNEVERLD